MSMWGLLNCRCGLVRDPQGPLRWLASQQTPVDVYHYGVAAVNTTITIKEVTLR
ncbi:hypothetical protein SAMN05660479_00131 [Microbulbifer thermotolerans]|nr:hypothetical protein SAMN05660479_00131 [Microbulbifer thermotolerans]